MRGASHQVTIQYVSAPPPSHIHLAETICIEALRKLFFAENTADEAALHFDVHVRSFYQLGVLDFDAEIDVVVREVQTQSPVSSTLRSLLVTRGGEAFHLRALVNTTAVRFLLDGSQVEALDDVRTLLE